MRTWWLVVAACNSTPQLTPEDATIDAAESDAARADAAAPLDPWNQPLGSALAGVTLADGWTDLRALPAPMQIAGGWTDSLFATPDGVHLRFAYQPVDFFDFFNTMGSDVELTGSALAGDSSATFQMFDAALTGSGWTITADPVDVPSLTMCSPASNASDDLLVFTEFAASGQSTLYYSSFANAAWSPPQAVPIGSGGAYDDNAKIDGELSGSVAVYFESNRGSAMQRTLYTTTYAGSAFSPVTSMGVATTNSDDSQPFVTADQQTLYFTSVRDTGYGVFAATRAGSAWTNIHPVAIPTTDPTKYAGNVTILGEASVVTTPEGELLYMMCGLAENRQGSDTYGNANYVALIPCVARR
ncbi:MAG TPA: hypothetical protein VGG28_19710 [Kofleriaceae bacterium]|jgi:hypothetical protein